MKNIRNLLLLAIILICLTPIFIYAQVTPPDDLGNTAEQTTGGILTILEFFGVKTYGFKPLILLAVPFIFRYIEKRNLKATIRNNETTAKSLGIKLEPHETLLKKFIKVFKRK